MSILPLVALLPFLSLSHAVPWLSSLSLGVDYYPETWDPARWEVDASAMEAANITTVRLAEFAWHKFQPTLNSPYNFTWLDSVLSVLSSHGIRAVVGTPTASPPQWLYTLDPTISLVDASQARVGTGSRQNMNHLHPLIISTTVEIVSAMAMHYANTSSVAAFQIDNEIHGEPDFSQITQQGFAAWLQNKYATTDAMNTAWGTQFWGEEYNTFSEVPLPWDTADGHNPSLALDYRRFIAHVGASYLELQTSTLRKYAPSKPLTHNCMGMYNAVDYSRFGRALDSIAFDNYPMTWFGSKPTNYAMADEAWIYQSALNLAAMRGAKGGAPFTVMEQQASNTGQFYYYGAGWIAGYRLGVWQSVANGADGVQFFRWRTTRWGQEQHWEGVLNWDGATTTSPRYQAVAALGAEFTRMSPHVFSRVVVAKVGILWSLESAYSFEEQTITSPAGFNAQPQMLGFLTAFRALGVDVDVVYLPVDTGGAGPPAPPIDFSQYSVLIAPSLLIVPDALSSALEAFVARGGNLFLSMRSGAKDGNNVYVDTPLPGPLAGIAGVTMDTWDPMCSLGEVSVVGESLWAGGNHSVPIFPNPAGVLCEVLIPTSPTTTVIGRYGEGIHGGKPAITLNRGGSGGGGACVYSGTSSASPDYFSALARLLVPGTGLPNMLPSRLPYGVEVSTRVVAPPGGGGGSTVFVLNWNAQSQVVTLPRVSLCKEVLHEVPIPVDPSSGAFVVPGYDVAIFSCP